MCDIFGNIFSKSNSMSLIDVLPLISQDKQIAKKQFLKVKHNWIMLMGVSLQLMNSFNFIKN